MYRLIFLNGRMKGRRLAVQQGTLTIGRHAACQVDLADDDQVSREHASIEQRKDGIWIKDLGALNKTSVNGKPIDEAKLRHGDRIEIGRTQLEFQVIDVTAIGAGRRVSKVQVLTFGAIGAILLLEAASVFIFPLWQKDNLSTPPPTLVAAPTGAPPRTVDEELAEAGSRRASATQMVAAVATSAPPTVANEVQELKAAVAGLRKQVEGLATQASVVATAAEAPATAETSAPPQAVAAPAAETGGPPAEVRAEGDEPSPVREEPPPLATIEVPTAERPAEEDPLTERAKEMVLLAQDEIARAQYLAADQLLERVEIMAPEFVPAYVERARLYEKRGILAKAGEQWSEVMKRSMKTPLYKEAAAERQRLARAEAIAATVKQGSDATAWPRLPRRVRIVSVDRERFRASKEFDEMRMIRVNLKPRLSEGLIDADDVDVLVTFYDRVVGKDKVVPTEVTVPDQPLHVDGAWAAGEQKTLTATYIVPQGFRQDEKDTTGEERVYEGYRVRVFYKRELQDDDAQPRTLLEQPAPELPSPYDSSSRPVPLR